MSLPKIETHFIVIFGPELGGFEIIGKIVYNSTKWRSIYSNIKDNLIIHKSTKF